MLQEAVLLEKSKQEQQGSTMKKIGPDRAQAALLAGVQELIRQANDSTMPIQQAVTFLLIARHSSEMPQSDLIDQVGVEASSVSRNLARLGDGEKPLVKPGLLWIEVYRDPAFRKRNLIRLTPRGRTVAAGVIAKMQEILG
jgi:DNA-binding MarR family transcriptional regulator